MAPILPIIQAVAGGVQIGSKLLNKPRKRNFVPVTDYLQRYKADLRSRGDEAFNQAIRPALRTIGRQARQQRSDLEAQLARTQAGPGTQAAALLQQQQGVRESLGQATEAAQRIQSQVQRQSQAQIDRANLQAAQLQAQGEQNFQQALQQYRASLPGAIAGGVSQIAGGIQGFQQAQAAQQQQEALNEAIGNLDLDPAVRETILNLPEDQQNRILTDVIGMGIQERVRNQQSRAAKIDAIQQSVPQEIIEQALDGRTIDEVPDIDTFTQQVESLMQQQRIQQQAQLLTGLAEQYQKGMTFQEFLPIAAQAGLNAQESRLQYVELKAEEQSSNMGVDKFRTVNKNFMDDVVSEIRNLTPDQVRYRARQYGLDPDYAVETYKAFWEQHPQLLSPEAQDTLDILKSNVQIPTWIEEQDQIARIYYNAMQGIQVPRDVQREVLQSIGTSEQLIDELLQERMQTFPARGPVDPNAVDRQVPDDDPEGLF